LEDLVTQLDWKTTKNIVPGMPLRLTIARMIHFRAQQGLDVADLRLQLWNVDWIDD
jgi:hypothetical protein